VEVLGKGMVPCNGVKKGIIVDIESTSNSIRSSVELAESMANLKIGSAYINIIGMHVSVINRKDSLMISNDNREITKKDLDRLLYMVKDITIPEDREIIDIIPRQYIIDGYDEIIDPVGMVGVKLEVDADIVLGKITSVQNILKSIERANIKIDGLVVEAFATGEIVLSPDEKELGVILLDVGGGVTDVSVFQNKKLMYYNSIPVGGDHITNDIAIGLKISNAEAEKLKREYELALTSLIKNDQEVTVFDINENKKKNVKVSEIVEIIEARVFEIFSLCAGLLEKEGINGNMGAGVVLAGGGISYVDGNRQLAAEVFGLPVRVTAYKVPGAPKPEMVAAEGIIKYVSGMRKGGNIGSDVRSRGQKAQVARKTGFVTRLKNLFEKLF
jgi:cell division protein FtsA